MCHASIGSFTTSHFAFLSDAIIRSIITYRFCGYSPILPWNGHAGWLGVKKKSKKKKKKKKKSNNSLSVRSLPLFLLYK